MTVDGFTTIAASRVRGFTTRMILAGFVCFTAMLLHPSVWPLIWIAVYFVSQVIDQRLFEECLVLNKAPDRPLEARLIVSVAVSVIIFSSMAAYTWFLGGEEGRLFAVIAICGALLHVSMQMYPKKRLLFAAVVPHALYLLTLPTISAIFDHGAHRWSLLMVNIGTIVFLANLALAVRQSSKAMRDLQEARTLAEKASEAKSTFLAVMSHEIRTPMNAVVSAANLLRRTTLSEQQREHVSLLTQSSEVLLGLVNDVLDLSKIEAGRMTVEKAPLDLKGMVRALVRLWTPQLREKRLKLEVIQTAELAPYIMTDPLRLRQILFNLLSNAIKFTPKGTIRLKISCEDGRWLRFEVADEGIGIASERLEHIFSSFEQAESTTTRRYGGTGLGLTISRRLARLMGGEIDVVSVEGQGSSFCLRLPYEIADTGESGDEIEATPEAVLPPPPRRVLIVDDHEVNRRIVALFIQPLGWECVMAGDGAEALEIARVQPFDLILMDMQMPVMGGIEATVALRETNGPNRQTPVVALTANALEQHVQAWADIRVYDVLTKPVDPTRLIETLLRNVELADLMPEEPQAGPEAGLALAAGI
ncbi:MAG: ATP-binding protein [Asticcacaulis sp.]